MQPLLKVVAHCSPFLGWDLNDALCHISLCKGVSCIDVVHIKGCAFFMLIALNDNAQGDNA